MTFVPWLWICWSMAARAPDPRPIMAITLATPMITPSMVRAERTALRRMARTARRRVLAILMFASSRFDLFREGGALGGGVPPLGHRAVRDDPAVPEGDLPV